MTLTRMFIAALAAMALAAPTALAQPAGTQAPVAQPKKQDLRGPDARPDTAGSPDVSGTAKDYSQNSATGDYAPALTQPAPAVAADTDDGIAVLPFVLAVGGTLIVGLCAGGALHLVHVRRRQAAGLAT